MKIRMHMVGSRVHLTDVIKNDPRGFSAVPCDLPNIILRVDCNFPRHNWKLVRTMKRVLLVCV